MVRTLNGPAVTGHKYGACMEPHQIGLPAPVSQAITQNLRGSSLSVLETIAPSETVLDPIPEEDDNEWVSHLAQYEKIETGIKTGNPVWTFCGKLVYAHKSRGVPICRACIEARPADYRFDPDFWSKVG
ncbi:uncharacterized protein METZ01_LOCUS242409 [marine metagenome]|uniref:Uncharacterized protein n=1 Tax=marine metagenome TaxID=408172 RepID=A0A382HR87_9ZZZZ